MAIILIDGFINTAPLPVDLKTVWASSASLYTSPVYSGGYISSSWRYQGMTAYCQDASASYQLIGGISDSNWVKLSSGSLVVSSSYGISSSYATSGSYSVSSSYAFTSSYSSNSGLLNNTSSGVFATTSSNIFIGNQTITGSLYTSGSNTLIGNTILTGSLNVSGSITGSLYGTSSWSNNSISSSYVSGSTGVLTNLTSNKITFSGSSASTIVLKTEASGSLNFIGSSGSLFSIEDNLSGSLMSVSDISGLPTFEIFSDDSVNIGKFNAYAIQIPTGGQDVRLGSGSVMFITSSGKVGIGINSPANTLQVQGNISASTYTSSVINSIGFLGTSSWSNNSISSSYLSGSVAKITPTTDGTIPLGSASNRFSDLFALQTTIGAFFEVGLRTDGIGINPTGTIVKWSNGKLIPSDKEEDEMVMGVIKEGKDEPIILGAETILVTGKIEEGDFIVTSNKIGHGKAIKRGNFFKNDLFGKVIAQSLESSNEESKLIKAMIRKM
jgi:hypothetical protein